MITYICLVRYQGWNWLFRAKKIKFWMLKAFIGSSHPEVFCEKGPLRNFVKSTGLRVSFVIKLKVWDLRHATLLKRRPWHRCFPVNFAKFLRASFIIEHIRWLLLIHALWHNQLQYELALLLCPLLRPQTL